MPKEDAIAILRFFSRKKLCKFSDISMTTIKTERTRNLGFQFKFSTMKQAKFMKNSAEKIGNNQDLLTEILLRLPTKSLIKFKCVSKQWLSLISNPQFCLSHTRHHHHHGFLEPDALLLKAENSISTEFDVVPLKHYSEVPFFDYFDDNPNINMLQSCNGLFLCEALDDDVEEVSRYFICNPTTKKFKRLSFARNPLKNCDFHVSLAFDPLKSPYYKIIVLREVSKDSSVFEIDIYSSETDYWAVTGIRFKVGEACIAFEDAVFCNGIIHWNSYGNESLCFDVEKQCLRKMPMPTPPGRNQLETHRYFGETRGTLHLARTYHGFIALELDVHQMASDYSHWLLKHRLNLGDAMKAFPQLTLGCYPFCPGFSGACFVRSEEEDEPKVVVWVDGKIICYDFNDGAWKMVYDPGPAVKIGTRFLGDFIHLHERTFLAYKYFENLSCI